MSRTIRRKNHTRQSLGWGTHGSKTALDFTYWDYRGGVETYRPMDKEERWFEVRRMHGESSTAHARSPGWTYRHPRQCQNRSINKQEMVKWIKAGGEYEPMFEANPRSCWWDWS